MVTSGNRDLMTETRTRLLNAAAELLQTRGYNGFSFHDLAATVGIKTASIHYHFPTKGKLGEALAKRYREDFMTALGEPDAFAPATQIDRYIGLFGKTLQEGRMCLCGIVGAEVDCVPADVRQEIKAFFDANEHWLAAVFTMSGAGQDGAVAKAQTLLATLEGAMLVTRVRGDMILFDRVAAAARASNLGAA
jgi:TetR/AcrR family transcriptional regulator, transcriptional repressor for nem operon